jgi:hypothetical protein
MIKSELNFRNVNDLKAWQDGSLINDDAIKRLSLQQLNDLNKLLDEVK